MPLPDPAAFFVSSKGGSKFFLFRYCMAGRSFFFFFSSFCYFHPLLHTHFGRAGLRGGGVGWWREREREREVAKENFFFSFRVTTAARARSDEMCNDGLESAVHR